MPTDASSPVETRGHTERVGHGFELADLHGSSPTRSHRACDGSNSPVASKGRADDAPPSPHLHESLPGAASENGEHGPNREIHNGKEGSRAS